VTTYVLNMSDNEDEQPNPPPPPPAQGNVKLSPFWPQAPALWFAQAEYTFAVKHVTGQFDQFDRYCHVVAALPHESLRMVADLVEAPPAVTAYDDIKNRLVASHQLMDFQKAEPALSSRKPSDLMAAMLETLPRGEEKSNLFACIFLQRLPREIRVLLANVDHKDPKALATRADELWALHDNPGTSTFSTVAVMQPEGQEVDFFAAVRTGGLRGGNSRGGARGRSRGGGGAAHEPEAYKEARLAAGMCFKLWRYGDAATSCTQPWSWQGNGGAGGN
jgi:hypothetical protein